MKKYSIPQLLAHFAVIVFLFLSLYPIFMMLIKSVKTIDQEIDMGFAITFPFHWANYSLAWKMVKGYIINSFIVSLAITVGTLFVCSSMAYGFTRYNFKGKGVLFMAILALMMMPGVLTLIPQYGMMKDFGLINSRWGVILPSVSGSIPMGVLLLRTFFNGLPGGLFEAADLDGANGLQKFIMIAIPLSIPIMATLGLTTFLNSWNDFIWPQLILRRDALQTISVAMTNFTTNYYKTTHSYAVPLAGYVIVSAPLIVLFSFTSRQFISGITSGAFKM